MLLVLLNTKYTFVVKGSEIRHPAVFSNQGQLATALGLAGGHVRTRLRGAANLRGSCGRQLWDGRALPLPAAGAELG